MPGPKLGMPRTLVWWKVSPYIETVSFQMPALGTAAANTHLVVAIQRMFVRRASVAFQTQPVTAAPTVQIQNLTRTLNITAALSVPTTYTVNTGLTFVINGTSAGGADSNLLIRPGDVISLVYVVNGATVGPGLGVLTLEVALSGKYV